SGLPTAGFSFVPTTGVSRSFVCSGPKAVSELSAVAGPGLIDVRISLRLVCWAAAAETTPLSAAMSAARPNPVMVAPQALWIVPPPYVSRYPFVRASDHRLRPQVEVNQRV